MSHNIILLQVLVVIVLWPYVLRMLYIQPQFMVLHRHGIPMYRQIPLILTWYIMVLLILMDLLIRYKVILWDGCPIVWRLISSAVNLFSMQVGKYIVVCIISHLMYHSNWKQEMYLTLPQLLSVLVRSRTLPDLAFWGRWRIVYKLDD